LIHLWDVAAGRESLVHFLEDVPTVVVPGLLILKLARPRSRFPKEDAYAQMADAAADRRVREGL
ncbi:MAG TPA: hypothetical protein VF502_17545, partial [Stellaceae bacterium]